MEEEKEKRLESLFEADLEVNTLADCMSASFQRSAGTGFASSWFMLKGSDDPKCPSAVHQGAKDKGGRCCRGHISTSLLTCQMEGSILFACFPFKVEVKTLKRRWRPPAGQRSATEKGW